MPKIAWSSIITISLVLSRSLSPSQRETARGREKERERERKRERGRERTREMESKRRMERQGVTERGGTTKIAPLSISTTMFVSAFSFCQIAESVCQSVCVICWPLFNFKFSKFRDSYVPDVSVYNVLRPFVWKQSRNSPAETQQ